MVFCILRHFLLFDSTLSSSQNLSLYFIPVSLFLDLSFALNSVTNIYYKLLVLDY